MKHALLLVVLGYGFVTSARADDGSAFFEKSVRPLLVKHCYECHSGAKAGGGLSLETRAGWTKGGDSGPAIAPGQPDQSLLIKAVSYTDPGLAMPPDEKGRGKLPEADIATLVEWVRLGAPDPRVAEAKLAGMSRADAQTWWAFQPLVSPPVPQPASSRAVHNDIDRFLETRLEAEQLASSPPADRGTLIRRATYDLTGLPPTADEVDAFRNDPASDAEAFSKVVERLLASPEYGVQWGRHWLDVARYADTAGENTDRPLPHAWRYRNWVFDAFRRDMPFDEFIRLQIAGDILRKDASEEERNAGITATGYLAIARRFGHDIDKDFPLTVEDVIDNLGKNFLGMTTGCARCHDHKYDPITAEDYYALYGIFDSTRFAFPGCEPKGQPRDLVPLMTPAQVETLMAPWRAAVASRETEMKRRAEVASSGHLKTLLTGKTQKLAEGKVGEGASLPLTTEGQPLRIPMRKGEVLQLSVSPGANHGADSTLVEWTIEAALPAADGSPRRWSVADLIPRLTAENPAASADQSAWCLLHLPDGPTFLGERKDSINGHAELRAWSAGDTPSVFVNASDQPVSVWTTLPAKSFFVHPGHERPVAVAWIAPDEGEYVVAGRVADAHPAPGLDGISFALEHLASSEFGSALLAAGRTLAAPLPDPGPEPVIPMAYAVVEAEPHDAPLQQRGDPEKPGEKVPRRWLEVFGGTPVPSDQGSGRQALGDWIARHPLAARVMTNRIWQWHFGAGLVRSPNDFGSRGERPTHLELLEWLSRQFVDSGYSVKAVHRLIMNSAAYQRSGALPAWPLERDPDNRLLARFTRRRLAAEEIRDSLLAASGALDLRPAAGHPFPAEKTWTFTQHTPFNAVYDTTQRSAYLMVQRQRRHPFLALFDGADPNASTPARQATTIATQALYFLNDPFFHEQARQLAANVAAAGTEDPQRLASAYRTLFQRAPTDAESEKGARFLARYPGTSEEKWSAYLRVLLASNAFLYVD